MIHIKHLNINPRGDKLIIDAGIVVDSLFKDCYIKKIFIDTQDTYTIAGPSERTVYELDITEYDASMEPNSKFELDDCVRVRDIHVVIPQEEICASLKSDFLIVYIQADGNFDKSQISRCESSQIVVGCVYWMKPMYNQFLAFIRELNERCDVPRNYIYKFMQYHALQAAVSTGNMVEAIMIFNKYIRYFHPHHKHKHEHDDEHHHHDHHIIIDGCGGDCMHHDHHHFHDHHHHHHFDDHLNFIHNEHHKCNCNGGNNI